jgi:hypothetical protein
LNCYWQKTSAPKARNSTARGASPGKSEVGKQALKGRHRFVRYLTARVTPAGLQLCHQGSDRCAASTLGFAVARFQRYSHAQLIAIQLLQVTSMN